MVPKLQVLNVGDAPDKDLDSMRKGLPTREKLVSKKKTMELGARKKELSSSMVVRGRNKYGQTASDAKSSNTDSIKVPIVSSNFSEYERKRNEQVREADDEGDCMEEQQ